MIHVTSVIEALNFGGGENRLLNLARSFDRERFSLRVVTLFKPHPFFDNALGDMRGEFEKAGVNVTNLGIVRRTGKSLPGLKLFRTAAMLAHAIMLLRRELLSKPINFVDTHLESAALIGTPAALAARIPSSCTLYNANPQVSYAFRRQIHPWLLRKSAEIITDSESSAKEFAHLARIPERQVRVIANGVRLASPSRNRASMLSEWRLPPEATTVAQVSGLVPFKGHRILLDAAKLFLANQPNVFLVFIGFPRVGADYVNSLLDQAHALGIADRLRICSYPGDIADVWNAIDFHVHASTFDSLPNAIIEGMSLAKPAVVADVGDISRTVEHGVSGLVVRPGDSYALAQGVLRLMKDREYARKLGLAAFSRYQRLFTPEAMCRQIESCWLQKANSKA